MTYCHVRCFLVLTCVLLASSVAFGQTNAPAAGGARTLAFEVASIRPSAPGPAGGITRPAGGVLRATIVTLRQLVLYAYDLMPAMRHDPEPEGGPSWITTARFDVVAKAAAAMSIPESRIMLRALLAERFGLRVHTETRDLPVYALLPARSAGALGPKLRRSQADCAAYSVALANGTRPLPVQTNGPPCGFEAGGGIVRGMLVVRGTGILAELVARIGRDVDRPIVDRTDLTGTFDIELEWANSRLAGGGAGAPSIFTALQEQLGLKLEAQRGPVEVLVIDAVQQPTAD